MQRQGTLLATLSSCMVRSSVSLKMMRRGAGIEISAGFANIYLMLFHVYLLIIKEINRESIIAHSGV